MPRRFALVFLSFALLSCSEPAHPDAPVETDPLDELRLESGAGWRAVFADDSRFPTMVDSPPPRGAPPPSEILVGQAPDRARRFLLAHPALFSPALAAATLETRDVTIDPLGGARVRLVLLIGGLRFDGGDLLVVLAASGAVRAASGAVPRASVLDGAPTVAADEAGAAALRALAARSPAGDLAVEAAELVAVESAGAVVPAWRVVATGADGATPLRRELLVDARTGAVLHEREGLLAARATGSGIDVRGRRRRLELVERSSGRYDLADSVHGVHTYTAAGSARFPGALLHSLDPDSWDEGVFGAGAAVDAHANAGEVIEYLSATLHRSALDGRGGLVRLVVHAGDRLDNAFWDGRHAVFGDGDGRAMLPLSAGLDVVAHEMFHGVTQSESNLVYEGEPGALNESLSDVFGCLVEQDRRDGNWTIGEDVADPPLRDLADPERTNDPAHMKDYVHLPLTPEDDMGGVHRNSTIPSHAAYLVAVGGPFPHGGGTVTGIGNAKLREIWWRAATIYLGPRARFADFAEATRTAAEDLYGDGAEVVTVEAAWRAVGVIR